MVDEALKPDWMWCAADYHAWDFEHESGTRLELKQSAARQTWGAGQKGYSAPRFDIAARKVRWEGSKRIEMPGRYADIYVFAYHSALGPDADHRNSLQWSFYVVRSADLPHQKTVGIAKISSLAAPVSFDLLRATVMEALQPKA